jgi:hypothetical protein
MVDELVGAGAVFEAAGGADERARARIRNHRALAARPARRHHRDRDRWWRRRRPVRRGGQMLRRAAA